MLASTLIMQSRAFEDFILKETGPYNWTSAKESCTNDLNENIKNIKCLTKEEIRHTTGRVHIDINIFV